jgi:DNA-binding protein H-NS
MVGPQKRDALESWLKYLYLSMHLYFPEQAMAAVDKSAFMKLSIEEQRTIIGDLQQLHEEAKQEKARELYAQLEALGMPASPPSKQNADGRAAPKPKYRSASNPSLTWAGRGQKPKWLVAEMEQSGKGLDEFKV